MAAPEKNLFDLNREAYEAKVDRSLPSFAAGHDLFLQIKAAEVIGLARKHVGEPSLLSVLDVGCGVGGLDGFLAPAFSKVCGVDPSPVSIEEARRENPRIEYQVGTIEALPYADDSFDVTFVCCVMHHVPPALWPAAMSELRRVTRPGGIVLVLEHNPLNPLTQWVVSRSEIDRDAVLLSANHSTRLMKAADLAVVESPFIVFFPWRGRLLRAVEAWLRWCPFGAQYISVGRK